MDFGSGSGEASRDRQQAFELAIKHVNDGGGVLGLPVAIAIGDTTADPEAAVAEARRLIEVEGAHVIVGPNSSANALPIAERVIGPEGVPTISFSATSPALTGAADNDFFFRTALSDVSHGPVLARVAREQGFDNVGLLFVNDAGRRAGPPSCGPMARVRSKEMPAPGSHPRRGAADGAGRQACRQEPAQHGDRSLRRAAGRGGVVAWRLDEGAGAPAREAGALAHERRLPGTGKRRVIMPT